MRLIALLCLVALLTGCTTISYERSTGSVRIQRFLTDAEIGSLAVETPDGSLVVEGYKSDAEAVAQAVAQAVAGAMKGRP